MPNVATHDNGSTDDECPVAAAIHAISGKWKMLVLRSLILGGPQRYNELLVSVAAITPKELTRNLRELESRSVVSRESLGGRPVYALTDRGMLLQPVFERLIPFGESLRVGSAAAPAADLVA